MKPSISVVIPTVGRDELQAAIASALGQSHPVHEVLVVADTTSPVSVPDDPRVTLLRSGPNDGGNAARMTGVRAATGDVIAFLDDDDEWLPEKIQTQVDHVGSWIGGELPWIATSYVVRTSGGVWPTRPIVREENIVDYLFRKRSFRGGQGALHTSTLMFPAWLAERVPLDETLRFHQDTAWLVRLAELEVPPRVVQARVPLVSVFDEGPGSVSGSISGKASADWARSNLGAVKRRTRGDFLATVSYFYAVRQSDARAAVRIAFAALTSGPPSFWGATALMTIPAKVWLARRRTTSPYRRSRA